MKGRRGWERVGWVGDRGTFEGKNGKKYFFCDK